MNLARKWKIGFAAAALTGITSAAYADAVPTYQEFAASTYTDPTGVKIVNGDEPIDSAGELRQFYDSLVKTPQAHGKTLEDGLIVNTISSGDDKWSASQALNLTYCVSTKFGTRHDDIVNAMSGGTALWEGASSKVNFVYVPAQDGSCNTRNSSILFSVEPVSTSQYIARAFFPSTPKRSRNVLVDDSIWTSGSWTPSNILGHELGHTLGFRHEHTRPESGTCFEDNNWRPLTPYDSVSIMHYPQCNGGSQNLSFSSLDAQGIQALYGS
jgi:hypothetical protein